MYPDVNLRVYNFLTSMMRSGDKKNALVVTHGGTIKSLRKTIEKLTEEDFFRIEEEDYPKNCCVTYYSFDHAKEDAKPKLEYYNKVFY